MTTTGLLLGGPNNDLVFINGRVVFVTGADLIRQRWGIRAKKFKGEWVLDENAGVPYLQEIFQKGIPRRRIVEIFREMTLNTEGVLRVIDINPGTLDSKTRLLSGGEVKALIRGDDDSEYLSTLSFSGDIYPLGTDGINIGTVVPETPVNGTITGLFRYVKRVGGPEYTDHADFESGPGIILTDGAHGPKISNDGVFSTKVFGYSTKLKGDVVFKAASENVIWSQDDDTGEISLEVTGGETGGVTSITGSGENPKTGIVDISGSDGISVSEAEEGNGFSIENLGVLGISAEGTGTKTGIVDLQGDGVEISVLEDGNGFLFTVDVPESGVASITADGEDPKTGAVDFQGDGITITPLPGAENGFMFTADIPEPGVSNLQEAYEGGPDIIIDSTNGPLDISNTSEITTIPSLRVTNNSSSAPGAELVTTNGADTALKFSGAASDYWMRCIADKSLYVSSPEITGGAVTRSAYFKVYGSSSSELLYAVSATMRAADSAIDDAFITVASNTGGSSISASARNNVEITSTASDIKLQATSGVIDCNATPIREVKTLGFGTVPNAIGNITGASAVDWTACPCQTAVATGNVTDVEMTPPVEIGWYYLEISASGGTRTVTGFTEGSTAVVTWMDVDPDAAAISITTSQKAYISLLYLGSTLKYRGWCIVK